LHIAAINVIDIEEQLSKFGFHGFPLSYLDLSHDTLPQDAKQTARSA